MGWSIGSLLIAALWLIFPVEFYVLCETFLIKAKILALNAYLLVRAWLVYNKLKADFRRMQIPAPPFRFTPIQNRD